MGYYIFSHVAIPIGINNKEHIYFSCFSIYILIINTLYKHPNTLRQMYSNKQKGKLSLCPFKQTIYNYISPYIYGPLTVKIRALMSYRLMILIYARVSQKIELILYDTNIYTTRVSQLTTS